MLHVCDLWLPRSPSVFELPTEVFASESRFCSMRIGSSRPVGRRHAAAAPTSKGGSSKTQTPNEEQPLRGGVRKVGDGSSTVATFRAALNDPALSDLQVRVGGTTYHVHRTILALRSPMFRAMLTGGYKEEKDGVVEIDNFPPEHFHAVLEWAYTGQATMTASTVLGVLRAADYCQFDDLVHECRQLAIRFVDAENLVALLRTALHFGEDSVTHACLAFWASHPTEVMGTLGWNKATTDAMCKLLSHPEVHCNEDTILASALQWLRRRRVADPPGVSSDDASSIDAEAYSSDEGVESHDTARELVERVVGCIRLGQLTTACLLDLIKPLVENHDVLRGQYMGALEYLLDPDRVTFDDTNIHLQPRVGQ